MRGSPARQGAPGRGGGFMHVVDGIVMASKRKDDTPVVGVEEGLATREAPWSSATISCGRAAA